LGDAMDTHRRQREVRLCAVGFEEPDEETRAGNLETSAALNSWPTD